MDSVNQANVVFEPHHASLNYMLAAVVYMNGTTPGLYESLITIDPELTAPDNATLNSAYIWKVTVNGVEYTVKNVSLYNASTAGYIRLDIESDGFDSYSLTEELPFEVKLNIYDAENNIAYYAELGTTRYKGVGIIESEHVGTRVENSEIIAISGPAGIGETEGFDKLFDNIIMTKLCSREVTDIIIKTSSEIKLSSYSFVGANDNNGGRRPNSWKIYGSVTGGEEEYEWVEIDVREAGSLASVDNYTEYNFVVEGELVAYSYYKIEYTVPNTNDIIQLSEILLYQE